MNGKVSYEILETADPDIVNGIISLYQAGGWWDSESKPEIIPDMVKGTFIFLAAMDENGKIIGMGRAISDGVSDAYIQDIVVLNEHRRKGIGKEIINTLTRLCVEKGILWIGLIAEPATDSFYEQFGFKPLAGYKSLKYSGN